MGDVQKTFIDAYQNYSDAIFRLCYFKVSDRELAKDMMQETFTKAYTAAINNANEVKNIKALLYRIARNMIVDEYRKRGRREIVNSLEAMQEDGFEPGEDETNRTVDIIDGGDAIKLISQIKEPYGETVFMKYVQGLTLEEIAKLEGVSENTISVRLHRGIAILKKLFNHEE